jgi:hypothetical protein
MIRCVYDGSQKVLWDSYGECEDYTLDMRRPCWQRKTEAKETVPEWTREFFERGIRNYKEDADGTQPAHDPATEQRLRDLGYL